MFIGYAFTKVLQTIGPGIEILIDFNEDSKIMSQQQQPLIPFDITSSNEAYERSSAIGIVQQ